MSLQFGFPLVENIVQHPVRVQKSLGNKLRSEVLVKTG